MTPSLRCAFLTAVPTACTWRVCIIPGVFYVLGLPLVSSLPHFSFSREGLWTTVVKLEGSSNSNPARAEKKIVFFKKNFKKIYIFLISVKLNFGPDQRLATKRAAGEGANVSLWGTSNVRVSRGIRWECTLHRNNHLTIYPRYHNNI